MLFVIFRLFGPNLIAAIINKDKIVEQAFMVLKINSFAVIVLGLQMVSTSAVQAMGNSKLALFLSVGRQGILYIPLNFPIK